MLTNSQALRTLRAFVLVFVLTLSMGALPVLGDDGTYGAGNGSTPPPPGGGGNKTVVLEPDVPVVPEPGTDGDVWQNLGAVWNALSLVLGLV